MAHLGITSIEYRNTPPEWISVSSHVGELVRDWAERTDLFTMLSPVKLPGGVVAHFNPKLAEIHIDIKKSFGEGAEPQHIPDLRKRSNQFDYAAPLGAAFHEAMHAKYSTLDFELAEETMTDEVFEAYMLLEESRIEGLGMKLRPKMRPFTRTFVKRLIMGELDPEMMMRMAKSQQAAHSCGIVLARVDAGVLKPKDAAQTRAIIESTLGVDMVDKLRALWIEFQSVKDAQKEHDRLVRVAKDWVELVKEAKENEPEPEPKEGEEGEEGESGQGMSEEQMEQLKEFFKKLTEAIEGDTDNVQVDANRELGDAETEVRAEEHAEEMRKLKEEQDLNKESANRTFSKTAEKTTSHSKVVALRDPLPEERAAAVVVGRLLDKAKYRDRIKTVGATKLPPGRLRMRSVLAGEAAKSRGAVADVEPWKRVTRHFVEDPSLTVGIMADVSGSMSHAMKPMGTAAWVMSEAIRRIQGKAAMLYFGSDVMPALKPGEHLDKVAIHSAADGYEEFNEGFKALDGALNLLNGRGARLLVIVSDGQFKYDQEPHCRRWLARCRQAGVAVLWIGYGNTHNGAETFCAEYGAEFVRPSGNITDDAMLIGHAGERALSLIGSKN